MQRVLLDHLLKSTVYKKGDDILIIFISTSRYWFVRTFCEILLVDCRLKAITCYQISVHYRKPTEMKLLSEFPRSRADNGRKIIRETCIATTQPSCRTPSVISPPPTFPLLLFLLLLWACCSIKGTGRKKKNGDGLLCDTRLPANPRAQIKSAPLKYSSPRKTW